MYNRLHQAKTYSLCVNTDRQTLFDACRRDSRCKFSTASRMLSASSFPSSRDMAAVACLDGGGGGTKVAAGSDVNEDVKFLDGGDLEAIVADDEG